MRSLNLSRSRARLALELAAILLLPNNIGHVHTTGQRGLGSVRSQSSQPPSTVSNVANISRVALFSVSSFDLELAAAADRLSINANPARQLTADC